MSLVSIVRLLYRAENITTAAFVDRSSPVSLTMSKTSGKKEYLKLASNAIVVVHGPALLDQSLIRPSRGRRGGLALVGSNLSSTISSRRFGSTSPRVFIGEQLDMIIQRPRRSACELCAGVAVIGIACVRYDFSIYHSILTTHGCRGLAVCPRESGRRGRRAEQPKCEEEKDTDCDHKCPPKLKKWSRRNRKIRHHSLQSV